jgi:hypothetical protein
MSHLPVGQVARKLNTSARVLTELFYRGVLDGDRCPIVAGRRMIPSDYLPTIKSELKRRKSKG